MSVFEKIFNLFNNSAFAYAAKKDKRQVLTLIVLILAALFSARFFQKAFAGSGVTVSGDEQDAFNQRLTELDEIYRQKIMSDTLNRLDRYIVNRYDTLELFKFNPNTAGEEELKKLGLTDKQIVNLLNFRKNGGVFKTAEDFRKLYGLRTMQFNFLRDFLTFESENKTVESKVKKDSLPDKYFVFDPNFMTREDMYKMGFSTKQIEAFMKLRDGNGRKFYVKKDFADVFFIDSKKYNELEKYIKIDLDRLFDGKKMFDLNLAGEDELVEAGLTHGEALDVVKFRNDIGYFYAPWQLSDCIKYDRANKVKDKFYTCQSVVLKKINLNTISEDELKKHPYFTDFQVKKIMEHSSGGKVFKHIADLQALSAFSDKDLKKLQHYLVF